VNIAKSNLPKVLVVEDQDDTRKLIVATLGLRNFSVEQAADSDTGWSKFLSFQPDLVLLDVMMPGSTDGFGLCKKSVPAKMARRSKSHLSQRAASALTLQKGVKRKPMRMWSNRSDR